MIKKYPIADAEGNLPGILREVQNGATVHLTEDDGASAVVVMSLGEYHRIKFGFAPKGDFKKSLEKFRAETDLKELNIEEVYADVRDMSPDGR